MTLLQRHTPFTDVRLATRRCAVKPSLPGRVPQQRAQCAASLKDSVEKVKESQPAMASVISPVLLTVFSPVFAAWADEDIINESTEAIIEAASTSQSAYDLFVGFMFGTVVLLLAVVTGGMIYLGVTQALDKKQELDDRQAEKKFVGFPGMAQAIEAKQKEKEQEAVLSFKKRAKLPLDKSKGFGSTANTNATSGNVATTPKEF